MMHETKAAVSVAEMARMVGLSRSRFYQLVGSAFPAPERDPATGRPYYAEDSQQTCLEVRRRNAGIDGRPILFYAPRSSTRPPQPPRRGGSRPDSHPEIIEGLRGLGMSKVTVEQVSRTVRELFPAGVEKVEPSRVIREVFLHLRRQEVSERCQNRVDNVDR